MSHITTKKTWEPSRTWRGFTLMELLVVVAIIVVLVSLIGGVGLAVIRNQKVTATQGILISLDRALDEYGLANGGRMPPFRAQDYEEVPGPNVTLSNAQFFGQYPSSNTIRYSKRPDAAVFLRQAWGVGEVKTIIAGLSERFLRITTTSGDDDVTPTIVDVWARGTWTSPWDPANPDTGETLEQIIYYIHPENLLAQELYGKCLNARAYFMSAGPDQLYGLRSEFPPGTAQEEVEAALDDNVYSYTPGPANRTADFFNSSR